MTPTEHERMLAQHCSNLTKLAEQLLAGNSWRRS
jgi:hypothetical protein